MGVDSKNPAYVEFAPDWDQLRDTYRGERPVKERGRKYLSLTSGMIADGALENPSSNGALAYTAYRGRAVFPEFFRQGVESVLGVMHHKPPVIELPSKLEDMLEDATLRGESLEMLLRRINEEQLVTGRVGLLLEVPTAPGAVLPQIALYEAEDMINWDDGTRDGDEDQSLTLVVLDESEEERKPDGFEWEQVEKYRVLTLGELQDDGGGGGIYSVTVVRGNKTFDDSDAVQPSISGKTMERIPFVFINTKDVTAMPDEAPLLGLSNLALTVYRGEADYRQALFMQGQDTLVIIGGAADDGGSLRVGAGASIGVPMGGDAKFIGVESAGLSEVRLSLENDYTRGESRASGLLEAVSRSAESGEALRVRVSARTASLNQIAMTSAFALRDILRMAAEWVGANPDDVKVEPNLDFVSDRLPGADMVAYQTAKGLGAPLALQTLHELYQERGITTQTWEDEQARLIDEAELGLPGAVMPGEDDSGATEEGAPMGDDELDDEEEVEDDDKDDEAEDEDDG